MVARDSLKVLIGCPTSDAKEYCINEYFAALKDLTHTAFDVCIVDNSKTGDYYNKLKALGSEWNGKGKFEVVRDAIESDVTKEKIVHSRNILREKALKENYDYFFSVEQDVIPPIDIIERLLAREVDIVSGVYFGLHAQANMLVPFACKFLDREKGTFGLYTMLDLFPSRLVRDVRSVGLGCIMIGRAVLEKVEFRFERGSQDFDDIHFCNDAQKAGFEVCLDSSMFCKHLFRYKKRNIEEK